MHELSIAAGLIPLVEQQLRAGGYTRVHVVSLAIGALANIEPASLAFCFDIVARGTCCEGARLRIERAAGAGRCLDCGATCALEAYDDPCSSCGSFALQVTGGTEMLLRQMEVT